ncbi:[FeFe] hydrogenase H-cluster radical SAM maturase HydE [bacterium]|nr:[FeFe] hydrogenase H-cluster radical SAM maturase HydE [bacterium]
MDKATILKWLQEEDESCLEELWKTSDRVRREQVGDEVHLRGLVQFSNKCLRKCLYCGLREPNKALLRYRMTEPEIMFCAEKAWREGLGTVVLQSGESDITHAERIGGTIQKIKKRFPVAVTLSLGEQTTDIYKLWKNCGADRYLLRFETSDRNLFHKIHPPLYPAQPDRIEILGQLRGLGYEIGGGIMVGLPGQSLSSIADDIMKFAEMDLDMIGIGPYIPHPDTPLGKNFLATDSTLSERVINDERFVLKVIALSRIVCPQANIPATTALATTQKNGYKNGLQVGANVIMPDFTPNSYRRYYEIYPSSLRAAEADDIRDIQTILKDLGRIHGKGPGNRAGRSL